MAANKTIQTEESVIAFIEKVSNAQKRADSYALISLMQSITGEPAKMWGPSIIGFGRYHYKYASGREGDAGVAGFSPRKQALTIYVVGGIEPHAALLAKLGTFKHGTSCLYVKSLADLDQKVLRQLLVASIKHIRKLYPE
jgi:hypothetical protein